MRTLILTLVWLLLGAPARAEEAGYRYDLYWGGFHAARLVIGKQEEPGRWGAGLELVTHGFIGRLFPFHTRSAARGVVEDEATVPAHFETRSQSSKRRSHLEVERDPRSRILVAIRNEQHWTKDPPDDPPPEPVGEALRKDVLDPLAAMREFGRRAALGGSFRLSVFDGRQRYDVTANVKGPARRMDGERVLDGILVEAEMTPVAGFRKFMREVWEGSKFTVLVDPATGLPLRIVADAFIAAAVVTMSEPCPKTGECRPPQPQEP